VLWKLKVQVHMRGDQKGSPDLVLFTTKLK